jgi:hypothetical protein
MTVTPTLIIGIVPVLIVVRRGKKCILNFAGETSCIKSNCKIKLEYLDSLWQQARLGNSSCLTDSQPETVALVSTGKCYVTYFFEALSVCLQQY